MSRIALTSSLSDYSKLSITRYHKYLKGHEVESIEFNYSYRGKAYHFKAGITRTSCHYGGYRYWWHCPKCSKRVGVLYCAGVYVCRHCIGANYQSQLSQPLDKLTDKLYKIRGRLGWQEGFLSGDGLKPKGMHHTTYNRLVNQHKAVKERILTMYSERWGNV